MLDIKIIHIELYEEINVFGSLGISEMIKWTYDQYCIDLAAKNIKSLKRILKPNGTITAQVGSQDKKPKQVDKWLNLFEKSFGNTSLDRVYIPSFDCSWNFASSLNK